MADDTTPDMSQFEAQTSPLQSDCAQLHELFQSLTAGGFTELQALYYLACQVHISSREADPEGE